MFQNNSRDQLGQAFLHPAAPVDKDSKKKPADSGKPSNSSIPVDKSKEESKDSPSQAASDHPTPKDGGQTPDGEDEKADIPQPSEPDSGSEVDFHVEGDEVKVIKSYFYYLPVRPNPQGSEKNIYDSSYYMQNLAPYQAQQRAEKH